jgi:transposase-like protein
MAQVKTESEMFPLVESWLKSGLTQKEFGRQHGVSEHVFCYWVSRYRKVHPGGKTKPARAAGREPAFIRLSPPAAEVAAASAAVSALASAGGANRESVSAETVVELPSGVVLRFAGLMPVSYLRELVGLSSVCSCSV